ncbi:hypothetical protein [uncultured Rubinisphaera sp.]|uniref:hypothetical protein n=1 Tax=uncultured Rubinisphaera sp. TaxID=1678686 RepID=UPI000ED41571|nr:hypothetical protein [Planctomycetaceae bacterium]
MIASRQWNVIEQEFQSCYNYERPDSSKNDLPLGDQAMPFVRNRDAEKDVLCETRLAGLLKNYSHRVA